MKKTESGLATCIYEPRGDNGLEGYQLKGKYLYEFMERNNKKWFRVYPNESEYYETCSKQVFLRFFEKGEG